MPIKKKDKYYYKITLYSENQSSGIKPIVFIIRKENVEIISFQSHELGMNYMGRTFSVPNYSRNECKIVLKDLNIDTVNILINTYYKFCVSRSQPEILNLEVKMRSERIIIHNANIESSGGFVSYSYPITFIGDYISYILC